MFILMPCWILKKGIKDVNNFYKLTQKTGLPNRRNSDHKIKINFFQLLAFNHFYVMIPGKSRRHFKTGTVRASIKAGTGFPSCKDIKKVLR